MDVITLCKNGVCTSIYNVDVGLTDEIVELATEQGYSYTARFNVSHDQDLVEAMNRRSKEELQRAIDFIGQATDRMLAHQ